jgi:hypothetical protein
MSEAPSGSFTGGLYFDGQAVFGSVLLLSLMLVLSFGRILGLDRFLDRSLRAWKEQRRERERWEILDARQRLEKQYNEED